VCYVNERQHTPSSAGVMSRVGQKYIHTVHTVFLAGKSPNFRSYTVYKYGSSQPLSQIMIVQLMTLSTVDASDLGQGKLSLHAKQLLTKQCHLYL